MEDWNMIHKKHKETSVVNETILTTLHFSWNLHNTKFQLQNSNIL